MVNKILSYTPRFKLEAVQYAEKLGKRPAGRKFDVNKQCVREWCKQKKARECTEK
jgi:transposase-like protein